MSKLKDKNVLVTGGAGFIGSHLVERLLELGAGHISVVDDLSRGRQKNLPMAPNISLFPLTLYYDGVCEGSYDYVFHLAGPRLTYVVSHIDKSLVDMIDVTLRTLRVAVENNAKIIFSSSGSIYGQAGTPTAESHHPYECDTLYGTFKLTGEGMLRAFHSMYGLEAISLRYGAVYGPRMDDSTAYSEVMMRWLKAMDADEPAIIHGDGSQTMDFVYVEDVVNANILAAESDITNDTFNIATGVETTLVDLQEKMRRAYGKKKFNAIFKPARDVGPAGKRCLSIDRAETLLGYEAKTDVDAGLKKLIEWWRKR